MSETPEMNEARFIELIGCYGADLMRWPADDRVRAEEMMRDAPHRLRDVWESERLFDMLLALDVEPAPSVALERRVLANAPGVKSARKVRRWFPEIASAKWMAGGALAASLGFGLVVGYAGTPTSAEIGADYAQLLSLTEAGAGEVFFSAVGELD